MGRNRSVRATLRSATSDAHARVDQAFGRFDLSGPEGYGRFLQAQAAALLPLERALDEGVAPVMPIEWLARRRSEALRSDLVALGLTIPAGEALPPINDTSDALGSIYVLEGSRMGGALLRRMVGAGLPSQFLAPAAPRLWRDLVQALDALLSTEPERDRAIGAAQAAFARFEQGAVSSFADAVL